MDGRLQYQESFQDAGETMTPPGGTSCFTISKAAAAPGGLVRECERRRVRSPLEAAIRAIAARLAISLSDRGVRASMVTAAPLTMRMSNGAKGTKKRATITVSEYARRVIAIEPRANSHSPACRRERRAAALTKASGPNHTNSRPNIVCQCWRSQPLESLRISTSPCSIAIRHGSY